MTNLVLIFALLTAPLALAQIGGSPSDLSNIRHGKMKSGQSQTPNKTAAGEIRGHCTVIAGGGNLVELPCVDTILALNNSKGEEVLKTRTDRNGNFDFSIEAEEDESGKTDHSFQIVSGSRFYEVVSPKAKLYQGQTIDLKMQQK